MVQMKPPYRAEHVGSLPRPERLMAARERHAAGQLSKAELTQVEDECIREAVAMQERVGIGAITDGEYRKRGWREFLYDKCDARRPIKANLPTPSVVHFFTGDTVLDRSAYGNREELIDDLARIMRQEIADLSARGCTYLQMDEVPLAVICDPKNMEVVRARGDDPDELIDLYIDAINSSIQDRPANMTVCVHMCRGNYAQGMANGGYEPIAERMFNGLDVDGYFLEYDTSRAGDFSPLRHLPRPKKAVLGLVSTKAPELETTDALKRRIDEATKFIDLERLCLSPQCGFASIPARAGRGFPMELTERKLARVVEVAGQIWK